MDNCVSNSNFSHEDYAAFAAVAKTVKFLCNHGAWEQEQTHTSLMPYAIEEVQELNQAVLDMANSPTREHKTAVIEELGDVLLQVLFHACLGEKSGEFTLSDIATSLEHKLKERSAPIFQGKHLTAQEQDAYWQKVKNSKKLSPPTLPH